MDHTAPVAGTLDPLAPTPTPSTGRFHDSQDQKLVIFTYPKTIFLLPTLLVAVVCGLGMLAIGDHADARPLAGPGSVARASARPTPRASDAAPRRRFTSTRNVLAMAFLGVFGLNLLMISIDFPRFTMLAFLLLGLMLVFFVLWMGVYLDLVPPLVALLERVSAAANAQFYLLVGAILLLIFGVIYGTRYLDYWVIQPNEILHNHGPFSDLERFPTLSLKYDKEIRNVPEYLMLRSGRIILHVASEKHAIVLDNVLWIDHKEARLKRLMGRVNIRVTTDREAGEDDRTA